MTNKRTWCSGGTIWDPILKNHMFFLFGVLILVNLRGKYAKMVLQRCYLGTLGFCKLVFVGKSCCSRKTCVMLGISSKTHTQFWLSRRLMSKDVRGVVGVQVNWLHPCPLTRSSWAWRHALEHCQCFLPQLPENWSGAWISWASSPAITEALWV